MTFVVGFAIFWCICGILAFLIGLINKRKSLHSYSLVLLCWIFLLCILTGPFVLAFSIVEWLGSIKDA